MKKFLEWGLIFVVVGSVLYFGGVQPLAYSPLIVLVFFFVLVLVVTQTREGKIDLPIPWGILPFVVLVLLQLAPLPPRVVAFFSPAHALPGKAVGNLFGATQWVTFSIYPHASLVALLKLLAYCGAFALAAFVFDTQKGKSALIRALIFLGIFEAVYGAVQYLAGYQRIFTYRKEFYTEEATGTYINRNHFAGFLELVIPFVVASIFLLVQSLGSSEGQDTRQQRSARVKSLRAEITFYSFLVVLLVIALVFSRSRMGIFSIFMTLIFMAFLGQLQARRKIWMIGTLIILAVSATYAVWIGLGPVVRRFALLRQVSAIEDPFGRVALWRDITHLIRDFPIVGTGLGTFDVAFRRYQTVALDLGFDHAHSDYLELASETGLLGAALLFVPILFLWGKMIVAFVRSQSRYRSSILLGCIGSVTALLIHSTTDFNLQIPANALIFSIVLGIGYKAAGVESRVGSSVPAGGPRGVAQHPVM